MKVLLQIRPDAFSRFGGDTQQLIKTREALLALGVTADVSLALKANVRAYDLVHLFNISRVHDTYIQYVNARRQEKPVIVSPIYQSQRLLREYYDRQFTGITSWMAKTLGFGGVQCVKGLADSLRTPALLRSAVVQCCKGYQAEQEEIVRNATLLLVNSEQESLALRKELRPELPRIRIVPNGVEINDQFTRQSPGIFAAASSLGSYVLYPGRIEPLKNQIGFLDAIEGLGLPVIFAGSLSNRHKGYCNRFLREVARRPQTLWIDKLERRELFAAYAGAKVVALASWFETTGLVGLEGGIMGANIVITSRGYTREYYDDNAWYCDPADPRSVRSALLAAFEAERGKRALAGSILRKTLTWENAARLTLEYYHHALSGYQL